MSLFDLFKRREEMSKPPRPSAEDGAFKDPAALNLQELLLIASQGKPPLKWFLSANKRLLEIAFIDHGVSREDRALAVKAFEGSNADIEKFFTEHPEAAELGAAHRKASNGSLDFAHKFGVGTIPWLAEEEQIVGDANVAELAMRPANVSKLKAFVEVLGSKGMGIMKPYLITELVRQRKPSGVGGIVLTLHGLATAGAPELPLLFSAEEITKLLKVPSNYGSAREILVRLGALKEENRALPLTPPPTEKELSVILWSGVKELRTKWQNESDIAGAFSQMPEEFRELLEAAIFSVVIHSGLATIQSLYGNDVRSVTVGNLLESEFSQAFGSGLGIFLDQISTVERFFFESPDKPTGSLNFTVLIFLARGGNVEINEDNGSKLIAHYNRGNMLLGQARTFYLEYLRFFIRSFRLSNGASITTSKDDALQEDCLSVPSKPPQARP